MRPKGPDGLPLKAAHFRVNMVPYHEAGLFALDTDPRAPALSVKRKLQLIDRAVDHVIDGDKPPGWIWKKDDTRPDEHFFPDLWRLATRACERVKKNGGQS